MTGGCTSPLLLNATLQLEFQELIWENRVSAVELMRLSCLWFEVKLPIYWSFVQQLKISRKPAARSAIKVLRTNNRKTKLTGRRELKFEESYEAKRSNALTNLSTLAHPYVLAKRPRSNCFCAYGSMMTVFLYSVILRVLLCFSCCV